MKEREREREKVRQYLFYFQVVFEMFLEANECNTVSSFVCVQTKIFVYTYICMYVRCLTIANAIYLLKLSTLSLSLSLFLSLSQLHKGETRALKMPGRIYF